MAARVQTEDFDISHELAKMSRGDHKVGAIASFVGLVRNMNEGEFISEMTLEHYPGMTEKSLEEIINQASRRWDVIDALIVHRVGKLKPGDQIVLVIVASAHRGDAFATCEFLVDYLKTRAPFWKKEHTTLGSRWVKARESDDTAVRRWETN